MRLRRPNWAIAFLPRAPLGERGFGARQNASEARSAGGMASVANPVPANPVPANAPRDDAPSDQALLVAFANGDPRAAQDLTRLLAPRALSYARRMLRDNAEAEDVVQEAMIRLWKMAPDWQQGEAKVSTWLYKVVGNLCVDRLRRRPMVDLDAISEPHDDAISVAEQMLNTQRLDALSDALAQLPERQRKAVILRHIEDLSNPQIAEILEISTEAVESLTARGKRALSAILADRKGELGYE